MPKVAIPYLLQEPDGHHCVPGGGLGPFGDQLVSGAGGLTQYFAFVAELPPGARSSFRPWHETEVGTRNRADRRHCPDHDNGHDLIVERDGETRNNFHTAGGRRHG